MKRLPTGGLALTRHANAAARAPRDVIANRLRHSLRLTMRCLEELRPLEPALRSEVGEQLDYCSRLVKTLRGRGRR